MVLSSLYFYHIRWFLYFFFSHLMVPSSRCTVPTSHVIVLLSHSVAPLFFLTFYGYHPYIAQYQHHIWLYFCYIWWFLYFFFLTFDGTIFILRSTNITCDYTLSHLVVPLFFFSHFMVPSSHYAIPTSHVTVLLSHLVVPLFFFSHFMEPASHCIVPTSHVVHF